MENPWFYAVIPADVRYSNIEAGAKLLYWEISALSNKQWFCFSQNRYFCGLYNVDPKTIQRWLKSLSIKDFIYIEIENNYNRKIFLGNVRQKCRGGATFLSWGCDKNVGIYNNTINNTINTSSSYSSSEVKYEIKEAEAEDIFCIDFLEFKQFLNEWKLKSEYPWKNYDQTISDCFLYYEDKWRQIKKKSAQMVAVKWFGGGDAKKREEEKASWEAWKRKVVYSNIDPEAEEIAKNKKMRGQGQAYIDDNPQMLVEIERLAYEKAIIVAKGNEKVAMSLKTGYIFRVAYDLSLKELTL